MNTWNPVNHGR